MSNAIGFLVKIGQDAKLRHASDAAMATAMIQEGLSDQEHAAILASDHSALEAALGARTKLICAIAPAREEDDGEGKEKPDRDDNEDEKTASRRLDS